MSDRRTRGRSTIAELAAGEGCWALPAAAVPGRVLRGERVVSRDALVAFEGNRYSVAPGLVGQTVTVRARLGRAAPGDLSPRAGGSPGIAALRPAPGRSCRHREHAQLLGAAVLDAFTTANAVPAQAEPAARRAGARRGRPAPRPGRARGRCRSRAVRADREGRRAMNKHATYQQLRSTSPTSSSPPSPSSSPPRSSRPRPSKPGYTQFLHDLLDVEVTATEQRRLDGRLRFAEIPLAPRRSRSSTSRPTLAGPPARRRARDAAVHRGEGQRAADRAARRRQDDARDRTRASKPCTPATASTTPPPPTSSRAPPAPRSKAAGRPRCASGTARSSWSSTSSAICRCPAKPPATSSRSSAAATSTARSS